MTISAARPIQRQRIYRTTRNFCHRTASVGSLASWLHAVCHAHRNSGCESSRDSRISLQDVCAFQRLFLGLRYLHHLSTTCIRYAMICLLYCCLQEGGSRVGRGRGSAGAELGGVWVGGVPLPNGVGEKFFFEILSRNGAFLCILQHNFGVRECLK